MSIELAGLEKAVDTGNVSYDPRNHEEMCRIRQAKVDKVADDIPEQSLEGESSGDLLIVSWGGTYGATHTAIKELQAKGHAVSLAHIKYISPFPRNLEEILSKVQAGARL